MSFQSEGLSSWAVNALSEMLKDKLQHYYNELCGGVSIPSEIFGFTDDVLTIAVNDPDSIRIWCDSITSVMKHQTIGVEDFDLTLGVLVTYTGSRHLYGPKKRSRGDAILRCIHEWGRGYWGDGFLQASASVDYRFVSERMEGGSRRGLVGKEKPKGHNKEAFSIGIALRVRAFHQVKLSKLQAQ